MAKPALSDSITIALCGPSTATCACACDAGGPCDHRWDGVDVAIENGASRSCSRCGMLAIEHDAGWFS